MKLALFSDIHGNLPALEAVLADIEAHRVDVLYCLGDLVNFAPWPNEVIDRLRARHVPVVQGNHDQGIGEGQADFPFSFRTPAERVAGLQALASTNVAITSRNRAYLRTLPRTIGLETSGPQPFRVLLAHVSPADNNQYLQADHDEHDLRQLMAAAGADMLCMGHTHRPYHRVLADAAAGGATRYRHAVNVGSVGKPKDGDPRAAWCLLELTAASTLAAAATVRVESHRVAYRLAAHGVGHPGQRNPEPLRRQAARSVGARRPVFFCFFHQTHSFCP